MRKLFSALFAVLILGSTFAQAGRNASTEYYGGLYGAGTGGGGGHTGSGGQKLDP